jgi:hypothetical protein
MHTTVDPTAAAAITAFWRAFAEAEDALSVLPMHERVEASNVLLEGHLQGLALELSGSEGDTVLDLIVTAHGISDCFPLLMQLVNAAPKLRHHRLQAFRSRTGQPDFPIGMDGFELSTTEVLVACGQDDGQAALEIRFARDIPHDFEDHARNMTFIMIDHVLGEYDFAVKVGAVDFVDEDEGGPGPWMPLSQLQPVFDRHWADVMGRTGDFPVGEHQWEGMTLAFGSVDEEDREEGDDEDDEPQDTALVLINRSANPVAMRADLAYALTLDLAVPDRAALEAVQALQDQAATLLALPQLGILAYTMVRGGRRKAVYYVGDEQLAKQALAPLLQRTEAQSQALSVVFDPSWSGYFEFAVH